MQNSNTTPRTDAARTYALSLGLPVIELAAETFYLDVLRAAYPQAASFRCRQLFHPDGGWQNFGAELSQLLVDRIASQGWKAISVEVIYADRPSRRADFQICEFA